VACCIFAAWVIRTLVIRPLRALLGRDPGRGDAYATAPRDVRWSAVPLDRRYETTGCQRPV
jgi:hypothetical protein